jgi:acyl-coenzyme A thioesterase PaaI-like protein
MPKPEPSANSLIASWNRACRLPAGKALFSYAIRRKVPYSGSIKAQVDELKPGYARVRMADRRSVRNHFDSIHAVAMTNLGELASGLAMTASIPAHFRGIPVHFTIDFEKKARGEIVAEGRAPTPETLEGATDQKEYEVTANLEDEEGARVARFTARWVVGPRT